MIQNASFQRKVFYLCLIALLLIPLYMIGRPATGDPNDPGSRPGGRLAQLRAEYDLSQSEVGEIDPASESMKLATLGFRGVAINILWFKANAYKKKENWVNFDAVVNQIAKLQPNVISVWEFQSHNLSYNISAEHDDYKFRYLWVKKGIDFLIQGTHYNRKEPKMYWTVGWHTGQKIGRADEHKQFRRLFRQDEDFHKLLDNYVEMDEARGPDARPDSWLASRLWYNRAYNIVDTQGIPLRGKAPHITFADGPKSLMNYAATIEDEGYLDEKGMIAWNRAGDAWSQYGDRLFPSSWGVSFRLNDKERLLAEAQRLQRELDELTPGIRDAVYQEKRVQLSQEHRQALDTPVEKITTPQQYELHLDAEMKTKVEHREVAKRAPKAVVAKASKVAKRLEDLELTASRIDSYRTNVNFEYWRSRCEVEQKPEAVKARKHIYDANRLYDAVELEAARKEFESAWNLWAEILDQNPQLLHQLQAEDLADYVDRYLQLLGQLDAQLPEDFVLRKLLEVHGKLPTEVKPGETAPQAADSSTSEANKAASPEK